jgi:hypothetical protein
MKKLVMFFAFFIALQFAANAQYDILEKQGYYNNGSEYAYGARNTQDNQYSRRDDDRDRQRDGYYRDRDRHNCYKEDYYDNDNRRSNIVVKKFAVERYRKDRVEVEICVSGPSFVDATTRWRGNTLFIYMNYPYSRTPNIRRSTHKIDVGRLNKSMRYDVVIIDTNTGIELGQYAIN